MPAQLLSRQRKSETHSRRSSSTLKCKGYLNALKFPSVISLRHTLWKFIEVSVVIMVKFTKVTISWMRWTMNSHRLNLMTSNYASVILMPLSKSSSSTETNTRWLIQRFATAKQLLMNSCIQQAVANLTSKITKAKKLQN